jgi:hypothetical protein
MACFENDEMVRLKAKNNNNGKMPWRYEVCPDQ